MGDIMDVGFIGLGNMGAELARNLLKAGHRVTVYNRTRAKAQALAAKGGADGGAGCRCLRGEILITMLADDAAVEAVLFGEGGAGKSLPAGAIHLSMSTISIALSERLERMHQERGQIYGTAPVFGRPEAAAAAKLVIVAGCPTAAIEKCQPLFDAMGQKTFFI